MSSQVSYTRDTTMGCWLWTGKVDTRGGSGYGYPIVWRSNKPSGAHRLVYELEVGPIPQGLVLDHLCRVRLCVAPHHLEPVTQHENELRKSWRYRAKRKTCKAGHDMAINGVVTSEGGRVCRTCNREDQEGMR